MPHQETITLRNIGGRGGFGGRVVEHAWGEFAASIKDLQEQTTVAARRLDWLEHAKVGFEGYVAIGIAVRSIEINYLAVGGV
jgi:hypothetical protein